MKEEHAQEILTMIREHWHMYMSEPTQQMWLAYLVRQDAEETTKVVARLAMQEGDEPTISDIRNMLPTRSLPPTDACPTCGGDLFVPVYTRKPVTTAWMEKHGFQANEEEMIEEMAPCPDCNSGADTSFRRPDGSEFVGPDPARVRELLRDV